MPESCRDRPTSAVEYVLMFVQQQRYYWDMEGVRRKHGSDWIGRTIQSAKGNTDRNDDGKACESGNENGRSFRNTDLFYESLKAPFGLISGEGPLALDVNPQAFSAAHFATYPEKLIEPLIKAATSEKGCCPQCGKGWERVVEHKTVRELGILRDDDMTAKREGAGVQGLSSSMRGNDGGCSPQTTTTGWRAGCECGGDPVPCVVADIFSGSGTTLLVANKLGRDAVGIELSAEYAAMAEKRIGFGLRPSTFVDPSGADAGPLFAGAR